jgi:ABC-type nickel/cobalt efflux system permease component RcnA
MTEVIAILVSVGLVLVTIVSAVLVWRTKQQASRPRRGPEPKPSTTSARHSPTSRMTDLSHPKRS